MTTTDDAEAPSVTIDTVARTLLQEASGSLASGRRPSLKRAASRAGFTLRRDDRHEAPTVEASWRDAETGRSYGRCPSCLTLWPMGLTRSPFHQTRPPDKDGKVVKDRVREICVRDGIPTAVRDRALEWADRYYVVEHLERIGCDACNQPY